MELSEESLSARKILECTHTDTLSAGAEFEIKAGEEELSETVPVGKNWTISVQIHIIETDV